MYVAVDFETQALAERLVANGFHADQPAFFSWLGVTMYLSSDAIAATLRFVAQTRVSRSGIIFDYLTLPPAYAVLRRWGLRMLMRRVAAAGEPWRSFLAPADLDVELKRLGFATVRDFGPDEINARFFAHAGSRLRVSGAGRIMLARL